MSLDPLQRPPYLDSPLDRWKLGLILLIFGGLFVSSLSDPANGTVSGQTVLRATPVASGGPVAVATASSTRAEAETPIAPAETDLPDSEDTPGLSEAETAAPVDQPEAAAPAAPGDAPAAEPSLPLTLANLPPNAIVPAESVRVLFGSAAPNSVVEVRDQAVPPASDTGSSDEAPQEQVVGVVMVGADGLWQLGPFDPLPPGQHVLTIFQLDDQGRVEAVSAPVVVTVLAGGEQGPLSLASPTIRFPTLGARLRSGPITFVGAALPGMIVRLYLDDRQVAEGLVSAREEWRLTPQEPLSPGVYVARVATASPQGEIIAESAPTVFWVEEAPAQQGALPLPVPSLPLSISSLVFGDRRRQSLVVQGRATPHVGVAAWVGDRPVRFTNVLADGGWQFWLFGDTELQVGEVVEIRSSLGERVVADTLRLSEAAVIVPVPPVVVFPRPGDVLTTRRPLMQGLAQPASEVAVIVNSRLVGHALADRQGVWSYQLVDPLPTGSTWLSAAIAGDWIRPDLKAEPVVVTVAPRL